jgi:cytosine/uracil/thiamine/allantoin permease
MRVEEFQSLALRWLTCISIVGAAVVATGLAIWAKVASGLKEIRARQDRATVEKQNLQCQVTQLAANMPAASPPVVLIPPAGGIDSRPAGE